MTHGSLFSGIGGFDYAALMMGWRNVFHCEINGFCSRILKYHFPDARHYEDITNTDFTEWRGRIDVLSGGFPCQPFSLAGRRKGAEDDRYLWPHMLRAIHQIRPVWVVGENVTGILTMVQPGTKVKVGSEASLFGEGDAQRTSLRQEYVIETVCRDLEREGYSVQPFVIPACAVGAPHRRDRVWIVARLASDTQRFGGEEIYDHLQSEITDGERSDGYGCQRPSAHSDSELLEYRNPERYEEWNSTRQLFESPRSQAYWRDFPTQSPVRSRDDGFPIPMDGITFSKWRAESIKAYGNAVLPQVVYEIFRAIEETYK